MANSRIRRTKSFSSYIAAVNQDVSSLQQQNDISGIADGAISGSNLASEVALTTSSIQSSNFTEGLSGWKIDGTGVAEFSDVFVRGDINAASGTIGYWNISSPGVERTIGSKRLFGTFLESSDLGDTDANIQEEDSGVYVGLFRSYRRDEVLIVSKSRTNNVAKIVAPNHGFELGDLITLEITGDDSFGSGTGYHELSYVDYDSFEFFNEGPDVSTFDGFQASGYANLFDENIAGLYLNDYSKSLFDHGYFSNEGVKYVSAQIYNYVHNPSFEYFNDLDIRVESTSGWSLGPTLVSNISEPIIFAENTAATFEYNSPIGFSVAWGTDELSDEYLTGTIDYPLLSKMLKNNRPLYLNFDLFFDPNVYSLSFPAITGATVEAGTPDQITVTVDYHELQPGDFVFCKALNPNRTLTEVKDSVSGTATAPLGSTLLTMGATTDVASIPVGAVVSGVGIVAGSVVTGVDELGLAVTISEATTAELVNNGTIFTFVLESAYTLPKGELTAPDLLKGSLVQVISVPDTGTFTVANNAANNGSLPVGWVWDEWLDSNDHFEPGNFWQHLIPRYNLADIRIKFSNGQSVALPTLLSSASSAILQEATGKSPEDVYLTLSPYDIEYYRTYSTNVPELGIHNTDALNTASIRPASDLIIDIAKIYSTYKSLDPNGLAAGNNIFIEFPGWIYYRTAGETPTWSKFLGIGANYYIDNVYISTENRFFYADGGSAANSQFSWASPAAAPSSASVDAPKQWINIDLITQGASLEYLDYVRLKSPLFSESLLTKSGIYSSASIHEDAIVFPGYQGYGNTKSTSMFLTSGSFNQRSVSMLDTTKTFESSLLSRSTRENTFIQMSSDVQYIDDITGYSRTYSAGFAANSVEEYSEAWMYADSIWITNRNFWVNGSYDIDGNPTYPDYDRSSYGIAPIGELNIDMNTSFYEQLMTYRDFNQYPIRLEDIPNYGYIKDNFQKKLSLTGVDPIVVDNSSFTYTTIGTGFANSLVIVVADPYVLSLGLAVVPLDEPAVSYIEEINYVTNEVTLSRTLTWDHTDEELNFYDENAYTVSLGATTGLVTAGLGISVDDLTTPGVYEVSATVQDITSLDGSVTIDFDSVPGAYDLSVSVTGGVVSIASSDETVTVTDDGSGNYDLTVIPGGVTSVTSGDASVLVTDDGLGGIDLSLSIVGDGIVEATSLGDGFWDLAMMGGYAYNHTNDFYPIIYVGTAAPVAPPDGFTIGDIWIDY